MAQPVFNETTQPQSSLPPGGVENDTEAIVMPAFDPSVHLAFTAPSQRYSFTQLGLEKPLNAPDVCYTEPFQLFSEEGVRMIRRELLSKKVLDNHLSSWPRAPCIIGYHEQTATWIRDMWNHPAVTNCIEEAFGLPVKLLGRPGEIGWCNVQLGVGGAEAVYQLGEQPSTPRTGGKQQESTYDKTLTDSWHRDSTQLVVVVMLSDTTNMLGGETAIRTGEQNVLKARGTSMGSAVLLQGGHTYHAALRATNIDERISMVTSYHFADPDLDDSATSMRSIKPQDKRGATIQDHFLLHKLRKLRERIDLQIERIENRQQKPEPHFRPLLDRESVEGWIKEQINFLSSTSWELFERYPKWLYQDVPKTETARYKADLLS